MMDRYQKTAMTVIGLVWVIGLACGMLAARCLGWV